MDSRTQQASDWLHTILSPESFSLSILSDDASFRRYFRVTTNSRCYALMDAPPNKEDCRPFLAIGKAWRDAGVAVPEIFAADLDQGFMLLEDFGDTQFIDVVKQDPEPFYQLAISALHQIRQLPDPVDYPLPAYDADMCRFELNIFPEWLLGQFLGLSLSDREQAMLQQSFSLLVSNMQAQPGVTVHRDFHSRNLMVLRGSESHLSPELGIIDFQGAVRGPLTYDLASLLRDCYIRWPEPQVSDWLQSYLKQLNSWRHTQGEPQLEEKTFRRWFDLTGMQRHIKAAGIFARLSLRDGKHGYLKDIPMTLGYIADVSQTYPELHEFHEWISNTLIPAFEQKQSRNSSATEGDA